ncbi:MAG: polyphosphate kinase 1, partial [Chthoniobacterales bacterium]
MPPRPSSSSAETPDNVVAMHLPNEQNSAPNFSDPQNFINRELSWLEFNRRVLEEAQDPTQPLLERVKFLGIVSSNLDEFFEIRVAGIKQQIASETSDIGPDGMSATETFNAIQRVAHEMVDRQYDLWNDELLPLLKQNNIRVRNAADLNTKRAAWARRYF